MAGRFSGCEPKPKAKGTLTSNDKMKVETEVDRKKGVYRHRTGQPRGSIRAVV
jgi:hypothetical protein